MKARLLTSFYKIFDHYKPNTICEIGTHDAKSAVQFVDYCLKYNPNLLYVGYDIFDDVKNDQAFHIKEINGKGAGNYNTATNNLLYRKTKKNNFKFKLFKGYTQDTLTKSVYDFVYIDGGHSYETVKHDYNKLKESKVIVFDDYNLPDVKRAVDELIREISLPEIPFDEALTHNKPCWSFLPHGDKKHIQPVIFN